MESPTERAIYTVRYAIAIMPVVQRGYNFEQASYMRWAGREVLIRLCKHPEILYVITPSMDKVAINRYFKEAPNGFAEIDEEEYKERKDAAKARMGETDGSK